MSWWMRRTNCSGLTSLFQSKSSRTLFIHAIKNSLTRHEALFCCSSCCLPLIAAMNSDALLDDRRRAEQWTPSTPARHWSHWTKLVTCCLKTGGDVEREGFWEWLVTPNELRCLSVAAVGCYGDAVAPVTAGGTQMTSVIKSNKDSSDSHLNSLESFSLWS